MCEIVMKKGFCYIIIITILLSCCGCSSKTQYSSIEFPTEQTTQFAPEERDASDFPEIPSSDATQAASHFTPEISEELDFRCIYRGFTPVPLNDSEMLDRFMNFGEQT